MNVSLLNATDMPQGPGNIFIADDPTAQNPDKFPMVFASFGDSGTIEVGYPVTARVLHQESLFGGMHVRFDALDSEQRPVRRATPPARDKR